LNLYDTTRAFDAILNLEALNPKSNLFKKGFDRKFFSRYNKQNENFAPTLYLEMTDYSY